MAEIIADDEWLCVDCGLIVANDDDSGVEDPAAHRARMAARYVDYWECAGTLVVSGCPEDGCEYDHEHRYDRDFSTAECAGCGTTLAGHRFAAVVLT